MTPPEATGGEAPNFEEMSPEEAMEWLESLAKRQGVLDEELTTSAGLDIPEPPPDAVVDEPGYTPYDASGKHKKEAEAPPPPEPAPEMAEAEMPEAEELDIDIGEVMAEVDMPEAASGSTIEDEAMADPMADPMAWLESLAKRQGVSEDELTTSADLDIPEPPPDAVIDEPGYTPFDPFGRASAREPAPEPEPEPVEEEPVEPVEEEPVEVAAEAVELDELIMADPMAWLESLAKRQGVSDMELTTAADLEVPEPPQGAVIDEPGYTPYDPLGKHKAAADAAAKKAPPEPEPAAEEAEVAAEPEPAEEIELPPAELVEAAEAEIELPTAEIVPEPPVAEAEIAPEPPAAEVEAPVEAEAVVDDLFGELEPAELPEWLRPTEMVDLPDLPEADLEPEAPAAEPEGEEALAWLEGLAEEPEDEAIALEPEPEEEAGELAGISEQEIEELFARGELTRDQEQAWLERQMDSFVDHREHEEGEVIDESLEPAIPGEMPDWLAQQMPSDVAASLSEVDEEDVAQAEVPEWLSAVTDETQAAAGDDWLTGLAEEAETEEPAFPAAEVVEPSLLPDEEELPAGEPSDLPGWLSELEPSMEAPEPVEAAAEDSLAWLTEGEDVEAAIDVETEDITAWLREQEAAPAPAATDSDIAWLEELAAEQKAEEEPAVETVPTPPEPEPVVEAPPPEPEPVVAEAPPPEPEPVVAEALPAEPEPQITETPPVPRPQPVPTPIPTAAAPSPLKVETTPEQVQQWFQQARALKKAGQFEDSLEHYHKLALAEQHLGELADELEDIARQLPASVQVRRILGDVYMRQNRLQEALDTYRGALDQL